MLNRDEKKDKLMTTMESFTEVKAKVARVIAKGKLMLENEFLVWFGR